MPLVRYALAAAAACLVGGAAYAQTDTTAPSMASPPAAANQSATTPDMSAQPAPPADQAATGQPANTSATVTDTGGTQVIASQPVPDTPANRAKYGAPMSHAGKRTAPTGD